MGELFIEGRNRLLTRGTHESAGYDVAAINDVILKGKTITKVSLDVKISDGPENIYAQLLSRSSICINLQCITVGSIIDEVNQEFCSLMYNISDNDVTIKAGQKICQAIFYHTYQPTNLSIELISEDAKIPQLSKLKSYDISSCEDITLLPHKITKVHTGIKIDMSKCKDIYMQLSSKTHIDSYLTVGGVIDKDYSGEIICLLFNITNQSVNVCKGEIISQAIFYNIFHPLNVKVYMKNRNQSGFGSTDE